MYVMIKEKKILRIEDMCGNKVYLGWESVSKVWFLETVLSYRLSYSWASNLKHFYDDVIRVVAEMSGDANTNIYNIVDRLLEKSDYVCCMLEVLFFIVEKALFDVQIGLHPFLDTINKYISNSDTSNEEEYKAVEQNGKGSETTKEEESKKSKVIYFSPENNIKYISYLLILVETVRFHKKRMTNRELKNAKLTWRQAKQTAKDNERWKQLVQNMENATQDA
ncbi:hypothetical protein FQA39_LY02478 [Lamprigera yunnana]|nr:hypothetical protein FQA39_LY02478 [Lamprigera yunnana]